MIIAMDACSAILLSKAGLTEIFSMQHRIVITSQTYKEIIKGKEKKADDALIIEKLCNDGAIKKNEAGDKELFKKIKRDFGFGDGEASTIAFAVENKSAILTDNKQARKASKIYGLKLIGSPEAVVSLYKAGKISRDKALSALKKIKEFGWFGEYIIEKSMEEIENEQ